MGWDDLVRIVRWGPPKMRASVSCPDTPCRPVATWAVRRMQSGALAGVSLFAALGCSGSSLTGSAAGADAALRRIEMREPVTVAERIESDVELLQLPMGTMVLDVCPADRLLTTTIEASPLVRLVRKLSGTATTRLSADGLTPEQTEVRVLDGSETRTYRVTYTVGGFDYEYENAQHVTRRGRREIGVDARLHDLQSAMTLLRKWQPRLHETGHFYVVLGRLPWRVEARLAGPEVLTVSGAPLLTRRIDGEAYRVNTTAEPSEPNEAADSRREFSLWFDADGPGHPVRLVARSTYGDVTMTLSRYLRSEAFCPSAASSGAP
jgi:hypothetical protein